jgi:F-type H+-transporting ATPase subunit b
VDRDPGREVELVLWLEIAGRRERLEKNKEEIAAENRRILAQIRRDVVELTLLAAEKVTGKTLDAKDQRRLIDETIDELDVKQLVSEN